MLLMARENQGLQIALIVSVMLTIILGGTTYYFYRQYDEASTKAVASASDAAKKDTAAKDIARELNDLKKKVIGVSETEKVDTIISSTFKDDMNKYAGSYAEEDRVYHRLLEKMQGTINDKNTELAATKLETQRLADQIKLFEAAKQQQIDDFQKARDAASQDLANERTKFNAETDRIHQDETKLQTDMQAVRKDAAADKAKADAKIAEDAALAVKQSRIITMQSEQVQKITATNIDVFNGQIVWVDQRLGRVWISVGRGDALPRQITFAVYPHDTTDLTVTGAKKASIEVTQVLSDHLSEARVLEDTISNPIIQGDKIYTPLWAPGEKKHFALAGFMDVTGDGKSHLQTVMELIKMNDGIIDAYIDEKTNKVVGEVGVNTRYLVLGEAPNEKGIPAMLDAFTKIKGKAATFGVQTLQLGDLLQRMGWKNETPVIHYGPGANPKDFAAKPDEGGVKKSAGEVSGVFKPRRPPGSLPEGTPSTTPAPATSTSPSATPSTTPPTAYQRIR
jgi:hypothetical protein